MFLLTSGGTALSLPVTSCIIHRVRGIWEQFWGRLHPFEVIFNKNNLISTVSFIAFQWYCYKCDESGEHYWVSVHPHWLYGVMCPNECKGPGEQFGCLHMRLGTRLSDCAGPAILDKTVEKIAYLGAFFRNFVADRFFPSPLPLEAMLLGLLKKAGSLSISRKQLWIGGGGILYAKPLIWKQFCCVR